MIEMLSGPVVVFGVVVANDGSFRIWTSMRTRIRSSSGTSTRTSIQIIITTSFMTRIGIRMK
jgi:hypothetical protein